MADIVKEKKCCNMTLCCKLKYFCYFFLLLDFIISMVGGMKKVSDPELAEKCFMYGAVFLMIALFIAIIDIIIDIKKNCSK